MDNLAESIIRDILIYEMQLENDRIWIRNQNVTIPASDEELFLAVGMIDTKIMSARNETFSPDDAPAELWERQRITARENIQVDIHSRNTDAINRRWEIVAAMRSVYAQQKQEEEYFKIFRIPSTFINSSDTEGAEKLNKFSIIIPCHVWYSKEKLISSPNGDWYDSFDTRVDDKDTIGTDTGLIEFNIDGDEPWLDEEQWIDSDQWYG